MARTSCGFTWSAPKMVPTTWTSLRKPLGNDGRSGRSISRQVRMAWSAGLALAAEERAGDLPGGVGPLLDVDGQGEEVGALPHRPGRGGGGQHDGVADAADDGAVGQLGQLAGLERQGAIGAADRRRYGDGLGHDRSLSSRGPPVPVPSGRPPPRLSLGDRHWPLTASQPACSADSAPCRTSAADVGLPNATARPKAGRRVVVSPTGGCRVGR